MNRFTWSAIVVCATVGCGGSQQGQIDDLWRKIRAQEEVNLAQENLNARLLEKRVEERAEASAKYAEASAKYDEAVAEHNKLVAEMTKTLKNSESVRMNRDIDKLKERIDKLENSRK